MILINGKKENYAVDSTETIKFDWRELNIQQKEYGINIFLNKEKIYSKKEQTSQSVQYCNLNYSTKKRQKFDVEVTINEDEHILKTFFYSENPSLSNNKWITRLDDPIEKENTYYRERPGFLFEKEFKVDDTDSDIFLDIVGLGYYDVLINGKRINDYYLNSDVTNYSKMVYYDSYKINSFVVKGINIIKVMLGNGWYNPAPLKLLGKYNMRFRMTVGKPMFICEMTQFKNSTQAEEKLAVSDTSWESKYTNLLFDNLYIGETRDFAHELEELPTLAEKGIQLKTVQVGGPAGILKPSKIEKIKRQDHVEPVAIKQLENGYLIDFGLVVSGQIKLNINTSEQKIILYYAEDLLNDTELDFSTTTTSTYGVTDAIKRIAETDAVIQKDVLYTKKGENKFENQFAYHSFKYVKIIAEDRANLTINAIVALPTYTDVQSSSDFHTSSESLNKLYAASLHTKKNNLHSYYEDCARERLGYGGDIAALLESQILSFDSENLLAKVVQDFLNDQTDIGGITQTAPYMGIQTFGPSDRAGSLGWQLVISEIVVKFKKYYGTHLLNESVISGLQKHLSYLLTFDYDYIKQCCLGDWGSIDTVVINGKETPPDKEFCSAAMYVIILNNYLQLGEEINISADEIEQLTLKIEEVKKAIKFDFQQRDYTFQNGGQSSFLFALKAQLVEDEQKFTEMFINKLIKDDFTFRCGIFGMSWAYQLLEEYPEVIYTWLNRTEHPSFIKMIDGNAQTLSEYFEKMEGSSLNHAMFSSYESWFITDLLGLKFDHQFSKTGKVLFDPYIPENLSFVEGSFGSIFGKIEVFWKKLETNVEIQLTVPRTVELEISSNLNTIESTLSGNRIQYQLETGC